MTQLLRLSAALALAATALAARPATAAAFVPACYSNLPHHQVASPTWRYSHPCKEGSTTWYVYIDPAGNWHLVGTTIQP